MCEAAFKCSSEPIAGLFFPTQRFYWSESVSDLCPQSFVSFLAPPRGSTSLLFAIYADVASVPLLSMLVEAGADPHKTDEDGVGALHVAAIKVRFTQSGMKDLHDTQLL